MYSKNSAAGRSGQTKYIVYLQAGSTKERRITAAVALCPIARRCPKYRTGMKSRGNKKSSRLQELSGSSFEPAWFFAHAHARGNAKRGVHGDDRRTAVGKQRERDADHREQADAHEDVLEGLAEEHACNPKR